MGVVGLLAARCRRVARDSVALPDVRLRSVFTADLAGLS